MNMEGGTVVFTLALFLIAKIRCHLLTNLENQITTFYGRLSKLPIHQSALSSSLQPELLYLQWYVETQWSIVVDLTQQKPRGSHLLDIPVPTSFAAGVELTQFW